MFPVIISFRQEGNYLKTGSPINDYSYQTTQTGSEVQTLNNILLVGLGGFAGSVLRYSASLLTGYVGWELRWPLVTFVVNLLGSFVIGLFWGWASQLEGARTLVLLGIVGFCGGFTTFSAFSFEVLELLRAGDYGLGAVYVLASVILCVGGAWAGLMLTGK